MPDPNNPTDPSEAPPYERRKPQRPRPATDRNPDTLTTTEQRKRRDGQLERR